VAQESDVPTKKQKWSPSPGWLCSGVCRAYGGRRRGIWFTRWGKGLLITDVLSTRHDSPVAGQNQNDLICAASAQVVCTEFAGSKELRRSLGFMPGVLWF
jgi:hypothetical protein